MQALPEGGEHSLELVFSQQAIVDEDAGQPLAGGAMHQKGRNGGVNASAQTADDPGLPDAFRDRANRRFDEGSHGPVSPATANAGEEVFQDRRPVIRVDNLGMKLDAPEAA